MKNCSRCNQSKTLDAFHKSASSKDGRQHKCKPCANEVSLAWKEANAERYLSYNEAKGLRMRLALHGIPFEDWNDLEVLSTVCAICEKTCLTVIDHDHVTGSVRGFLCSSHNTALGLFQDSPELLQMAIEYLQSPPLVDRGYISYAHDKSTKEKSKRFEHSPELRTRSQGFDCLDCGQKILKNKNMLCRSCFSKSREKVSWPEKPELASLVASFGYREVGRRLGVSDNAVRKRLNRA